MEDIQKFKTGGFVQTETLSADGHGIQIIEGIITEVVGDRVRIVTNTGDIHITLIDQLF